MMFPHPLSWECKGVLVDARASQLFLLRRVHEVCVCVWRSWLHGARRLRSVYLLLTFCVPLTCAEKERISHKWNISVSSTHTHTHRCFLLCLLSNCGKQKPTVGFSESGKTTIGEQKKQKKSREFHMILMYTMLFICKAVYLSIV